MTHFLDTLPLDWTRPEGEEVLRLLASAYRTRAEMEEAAQGVGIETIDLAWNDRLRLSWRALFDEARLQNRLRPLVNRALADPRKAAIHARLNALLQPAPAVEVPEPRTAAGEPIVDARWRASDADTEKILGATSMLVDVAFLERGLRVSRSVARLKVHFGGAQFFGSGFLIAEDMLLTNHHVLFDYRTGAAATEVYVWFNFQLDIEDRPQKVDDLTADMQTIVADQEDDWAVIRLARKVDPALYPPLRLGSSRPLAPGSRVNIVQHPGGLEKKLSLIHNAVVHVDDRIVQYLTDTDRGSSGSPVFDERWEVVALHHSGGDLPIPGTTRRAFRNEGINIARVRAALQQRGVIG